MSCPSQPMQAGVLLDVDILELSKVTLVTGSTEADSLEAILELSKVTLVVTGSTEADSLEAEL